ncbi:peptidase inhibitor family I36 protein [Plantactinospora sp. KBS50]|uniref:peptidase inhibitor family I36 protein n=1 Tax=Plantactinospora sp. KBS50 TaxID=2024580 RepID=UPI000BAAB01F|nr:peptidase inhibitor family I36 protein [Plantactinospora sp. KBS50]ASW54349.1 hypothetical protein CIK06_09310 [Plantactinospora sp. KBS50]
MTSRLRSALLAVGMSVTAALTPAGVAHADRASTAGAIGSCPSGYLCLYTGTDFAGDQFTVTSLVPNGTCVSLVDHGWGDRAHSAVNTHNSGAAMFMNDGCLGGPYQVPANSSLASFGGFTPRSVWVPRAW